MTLLPLIYVQLINFLCSYEDIKNGEHEIEYIPGGSAQNTLRTACVTQSRTNYTHFE